MENQNNSYTSPEGKKQCWRDYNSRFQNMLLSYCIKTYITRKKTYSSMEQNRRIKHKYA